MKWRVVVCRIVSLTAAYIIFVSARPGDTWLFCWRCKESTANSSRISNRRVVPPFPPSSTFLLWYDWWDVGFVSCSFSFSAFTSSSLLSSPPPFSLLLMPWLVKWLIHFLFLLLVISLFLPSLLLPLIMMWLIKNDKLVSSSSFFSSFSSSPSPLHFSDDDVTGEKFESFFPSPPLPRSPPPPSPLLLLLPSLTTWLVNCESVRFAPCTYGLRSRLHPHAPVTKTCADWPWLVMFLWTSAL